MGGSLRLGRVAKRSAQNNKPRGSSCVRARALTTFSQQTSLEFRRSSKKYSRKLVCGSLVDRTDALGPRAENININILCPAYAQSSRLRPSPRRVTQKTSSPLLPDGLSFTRTQQCLSRRHTASLRQSRRPSAVAEAVISYEVCISGTKRSASVYKSAVVDQLATVATYISRTPPKQAFCASGYNFTSIVPTYVVRYNYISQLRSTRSSSSSVHGRPNTG